MKQIKIIQVITQVYSFKNNLQKLGNDIFINNIIIGIDTHLNKNNY